VQTELRGTSDLRETGDKARVLDLIISHRSDLISFINSILSLFLVGHRIRLLFIFFLFTAGLLPISRLSFKLGEGKHSF
jgi:hypothetical protein